jgi:hypothetical protein
MDASASGVTKGEVEALKAERDRLKELVLDHENSLMTFAHDINKLRAALEEIADMCQLSESQLGEIARRALEGK